MSGTLKAGAAAVPEVGLGMALRRANGAFYRALRDGLAEHGIAFSEFQHLRQLWDEDGITQVELARRIGIGRASSTSVLDLLERRGLIARTPDPGDRRAQVVRLTDDGRALRPALWREAAEVNLRALKGLSVAEAATLFDLLARVEGNLTEPR